MTADLGGRFALAFALVVGTLFIVYVAILTVPYLRRRPGIPGCGDDWTWHFCVPCRDEEAVIGGTIDYLRATFPQAQIWVIDDASEDATGAIVRSRSRNDPLTHLLERTLPDARTGKADALNFAWRQICASGRDSGDRGILAVVDADGRPSANLLDVAAGPELFGDPAIAAVQVEVRMSNAGVRYNGPAGDRLADRLAEGFVRMQDLEFRAPISAIQMSRRYTRTVNVGGNGQLARMSALAAIAGPEGPWRGSLLEDFELGLHFLLAGWRNGYTVDAWVEQEALYSLPRFLTQRARWAQGTMQCARYLPRIWSQLRVHNIAAIELTYFLLQPWLQLLGTVCYPTVLVLTLVTIRDRPDAWATYLESGGSLVVAAGTVLGIGAFVVWGPLYRKRCHPEHSGVRGFGWGLGYLAYIWLIYVVVWKAFGGYLRRTGWAKTIRNTEAVSAVARHR